MSSQEEFDFAPPPAASMVEALRGIGYSLEAAIADLVDNSIAAGAKTIRIDFVWDGPNSFVSILDDGKGLTEIELVQAMRPGSRSPLEDRAPSDLGRFGLGLKTASFSQCRRLTVATRSADYPEAIRRWDLDYVVRHNEWRLLRSCAEGTRTRLAPLMAQQTGTLVLWELLDRLVGEEPVTDERAQLHFHSGIERVREHLAMVFHRFLTGPRPELEIFINGSNDEHRIQPWDPFLETNTATIPFPHDPIPCKGGRIVVRGFVLPHKDRLGETLHREAAGPSGWNAQQGFYVYRNRRLLVAGSWLGLGSDRPWTKEEHYKLARIRLDIPNTMDSDWKIDVRKSVARPPAAVRRRLKELADQVRKQARDVFSHRGGSSRPHNAQAVVRAWKDLSRDGRLSYKVNREHPFVAQCLSQESLRAEDVERLLRLLEETVPVARIWLDSAEKPDDYAVPFEGSDPGEIRFLIERLFTELVTAHGMTPSAAKDRLAAMEPFDRFRGLISELHP